MVTLLKENEKPIPGKKYLLRERFDLCPNGVCRADFLTENERKMMSDGEAMFLTGIIQRADSENGNTRVYPYRTLKREMTNYDKLVREHRAIGECVDGETEIWTTSGWKQIQAIDDIEEIFTLNVRTNEITKVKAKKVVKEFKGKLLHFHNKSRIDGVFTPGHHVLMYDRNKQPFDFYAEQVKEQPDLAHSFFKEGGGIWKGLDVNLFVIPGTNIEVQSDKWAAFFGFYLAEGCIKDKYSVQLTQKKEENFEPIRQLLNQLPFDWHEYTRKNGTKDFFVKNKDLVNYLSQFGYSYEKFIPQEIKEWSPRLLNTFIDWILLGDGRNRKNSKDETIRELATTSKQLSEDILELFYKVGNGGAVNVRIPKDRLIGGRTILAENSRILYIAAEHTKNFLSYHDVQIEKIPYEGNVYCVNVPETHTWMMRRKGKSFWTFNCDHPDDTVINLKNASHMITKIWWEGKEVWGKLKVLTHTPAGQILEGLIKDGVAVGLSSRALGSVTEGTNGILVVEDDLQLICFDVVSEPSTQGAFMHLTEAKLGASELKILKENKIFTKGDQINRLLCEITL